MVGGDDGVGGRWVEGEGGGGVLGGGGGGVGVLGGGGGGGGVLGAVGGGAVPWPRHPSDKHCFNINGRVWGLGDTSWYDWGMFQLTTCLH